MQQPATEQSRMPAMHATPQAAIQQTQDQEIPVQKSGSGQTRMLMIGGAFILLAAVGGGSLALKGGFGGKSAGPVPTSTNQRDIGEPSDPAPGTPTSPVESPDTYTASMDPLIAENASLEQQIVSLAAEVNRVAPAGITGSMLASASDLQKNFENLNLQVSALKPPSAFLKAHNDFATLVQYNVSRSSALYSGTDAWKNNNPDYAAIFDKGRIAKESYLSLYPVFQNEYAQAKRGAAAGSASSGDDIL
jgi:hypothetical protein